MDNTSKKCIAMLISSATLMIVGTFFTVLGGVMGTIYNDYLPLNILGLVCAIFTIIPFALTITSISKGQIYARVASVALAILLPIIFIGASTIDESVGMASGEVFGGGVIVFISYVLLHVSSVIMPIKLPTKRDSNEVFCNDYTQNQKLCYILIPLLVVAVIIIILTPILHYTFDRFYVFEPHLPPM